MTSGLGAAFASAPRSEFLPPDQRSHAARDAPLAIGYGSTNSQPSTVRYMLELLDVGPGQRVLDVGSGSGWTTALLGELVGPSGTVIGVELVPELVEMARSNLADHRPWVRIELARDDALGWPEAAPFDRILGSADGGRVPMELEAQLARGGRMVLPAASEMVVVERSIDGRLSQRRAQGRFSFVPLR